MQIRAVLFDLDQTLWCAEAPPDWEKISRLQSVELALELARLGIRHIDLAEFVPRFWVNFRRCLDFDAADFPNPEPVYSPRNPALTESRWQEGAVIIRRTLAEYGVECSESVCACLWGAMHRVSLQHFNVVPYPDATPTIEALSAAGFRIAIVTGRPLTSAIVNRELRQQGLPNVFEAIVTSGELGYRKPHPLVFETAVSRLGIAPDESVMVGDSYEDDVVPSAKLGMIPVLKLNDRAPDTSFVLARYQVASLAGLLQLDIFAR